MCDDNQRTSKRRLLFVLLRLLLRSTLLYIALPDFTRGDDISSSSSLLRGGRNPHYCAENISAATDRHRRAARRVPKLLGRWKKIPDFPVDVGESQGGLVGCDLISIGGFYPNFASGPTVPYALDLCDPNARWREMADSRTYPFLTHAAHAHKGENLFYMCGGYNGTHAGEAIDKCLVFDKSDGPVGSWRDLPSLPKRRGGGGMIYIERENKLLFTLGAIRPRRNTDGIDTNTTWTLDLGNVNMKDPTKGAQWVPRPGGGPYRGNHVTSIVARDCSGGTRYFFLGGQVGEQERSNNIDLVYEYQPWWDTFVQRQSMPEARGHFTTAFAPYGCGFITVGGAINGDPTRNTWSDNVLYYDIDSDKWTEIGKYPELIKTPVCGIVSNVLYCANGYTVNSYKIQLRFLDATPEVLHFAVLDENWSWVAGVMPDNMVLDSKVHGTKLRFQAILGGSVVEAVKFDVTPDAGPKLPFTDSRPPYFLFNPFQKDVIYTLTATPYYAGGAGVPYSATFTIS